MAETDARRLCRKNARALRLAIEQSECEATADATAKAKAARLDKAWERAVQRMVGDISSDNDSDLTDGSHDSCSDDDAPPPLTPTRRGIAASPTTRGRGRRGNGDFLRLSPFTFFSMN